MKIYVDSDLFLALVKSDDRLKENAVAFMRERRPDELITSAMALVEVWFHYNKHGLPHVEESLSSVAGLVTEVRPVTADVIEAAARLSAQVGLGPSDAIHAVFALSVGNIVSTDHAFDRVPELNRIDFGRG